MPLKLAKYLIPLLTAALIFIWYISDCRVLLLSLPYVEMNTQGGRIFFTFESGPRDKDRPRTGIHTFYSSYDWWFDGASRPGFMWVAVPIWLPVAVGLSTTALAWRVDAAKRRRAKLNHCACGYDRTGLPFNTPCPECGK